jgi:hypothetical protein
MRIEKAFRQRVDGREVREIVEQSLVDAFVTAMHGLGNLQGRYEQRWVGPANEGRGNVDERRRQQSSYDD